jgi:hypothetical protein
MKKCLITLFILAWPISAWAIEEREGYYKVLEIPSNQTLPIFTVPEGKCFVLLQLTANNLPWDIQVNGTDFIDGELIMYDYTSGRKMSHDFPDRCVTVNSGETLSVVNFGGSTIKLNIIGYFYDCKRVSRPVADLTNDRKVDFSDFAVLASEWLKDGNINSGA